MDKQTNITPLVKELENVFTIDGRGRPRKAQLFLELMKQYGAREVMEEVEKMSKREWF